MPVPRAPEVIAEVASSAGASPGRAVAPLLGEGMFVRRVRIEAREVVFLKGVIEASEGLACVFAERGGDLTLAAPCGREREVDELIADLCRELGARLDADAASA